MVNVLVFGVFDVLHPGHRYFLEKARKEGDRLTAAVADDDFVFARKGRQPVKKQAERIHDLRMSGWVDDAVPGDHRKGEYGVVRSCCPTVICLGHDQIELKEDLKRFLCEKEIRIRLVVLPAWKRESYNSTSLNERYYQS